VSDTLGDLFPYPEISDELGAAWFGDEQAPVWQQVRVVAPGQWRVRELPDGRARAFAIDSTEVVHESDTSSLSEPIDGLTLVTCYPFHAASPGGPWRYVVRARAI
jgi:hypothetical protein